MKATYFHAAGALALTAIVAACSAGVQERFVQSTPVASPAPTPTPTPTPTPPPPPPPPVVTEPTFENYLDAPQTPGNWSYIDEPRETIAAYGVSGDYAFAIACDKRTQQIALMRPTSAETTSPRVMTISTETTSQQLQAVPVQTGPRLVAASLAPRNPLLDAMAITKGRVAIGVEGERTLYLPAWVEISRVIEDCR